MAAEHGHSRTYEVESHDAQHHTPGATVRTYVIIFGILFAATMIEVAASYLSDVGVPVWLEIATLISLAIIKGVLVVLFYMHLRFDSRWFTFLFTSGIILAVFGVSIFIVLFTYHSGLVN